MNQHQYTIIEDIDDSVDPRVNAYHQTSMDRFVGTQEGFRGTLERPDLPEYEESLTGLPQHRHHHHHGNEEEFNDGMNCRDVINHVENCVVCNSHFKKDLKFYWFVIFVLAVILVITTRKHFK